MKEIKFRGKYKNPYGDKWVYGYYALVDGEHVIIMPHSTSYEQTLKENNTIPKMSVKHEVDFNTIGQYTGLKDKNGVEIYDGDIVKIDCPTMKIIGEVRYSEMSATFFIYDKVNDIEETLWYQKEEYEVIGNIYDNPELLEKGV